MKDLNPSCFVIRGCRLLFVFFREQRSIESGQLDRIYSELIPSEMPLPPPVLQSALLLARQLSTFISNIELYTYSSQLLLCDKL